MPQITNWEQHIGRRVRLRDLFVFFTVVECGGMAKAAKQLGVSTPSISELISGLEQVLGARLLDRTSRGVVATACGEVLLTRGRAAFDELRQGFRHIEFMSSSAAGEVRIACPESLAHFLVLVIERVAQRYPRVRFNVQQITWPSLEYPELHDRKVDLALSRLGAHKQGRLSEDLDTNVLFEDPFAIVVGRRSKWGRRRKVDLLELADEKWVLTPPDVLAGILVGKAFEARGCKAPTAQIATSSIHLRNNLASRGDYIAVLPRSVLRLGAKQYGLKELAIRLDFGPSPVAIITLRGRTLTPATRATIDCAREVAARMQ
jgi:DNA-binding transcriptional LysR family regulator